MKISELAVGANCEITLVVTEATARETKAKKPYLSVKLFDGTDTIPGNYWDWTSGRVPDLNSVVDISAQVTEYMGVKQLNIKSLKLNRTRHLAEFVPTSGVDLGETYNEAYSLASTINNDALRDLTVSILEELRELWLTVPGAKTIHHAYVGGTLVHSLSVAKIAKAIASQIPEASKDLCIAGGLLHDLGKLFTYKIDGVTINMTDEGMLYEHLFIGAEFVGNFAETHLNTDNYKDFKIVQMLRHIILSHHGALENGSPVTPMCLEAYIVNRADGMDATAEQIRVAARKLSDTERWTERLYVLNNRPHITPQFITEIMVSDEDLPFK